MLFILLFNTVKRHELRIWALWKKANIAIINFNHKMWNETVAFDNKFVTKESLKFHLNLSWFKLYPISHDVLTVM